MIIVRLHSALELKYYRFLQEVFDLCYAGGYFKLANVAKKHNLSVIAATALRRLGLVKLESTRNVFGDRVRYYTWKSEFRPSINTAEAVIKAVREYYKAIQKVQELDGISRARVCEKCLTGFKARRSSKRFCSSSCKQKAYLQRKEKPKKRNFFVRMWNKLFGRKHAGK